MNMKYAIAFLAVFVLTSQSPLRAANNLSRPNIIVMLIDDLGYGDVGAFGCPDIPTPHIDSLARDGVRCLNGYTLCPVCSPSRAGLMTGLYPQRFRVNGNLNRGEPIPAEHPTLAECLRDAGYVTGMVGRWDLGDAKQGPLDRGFREVAKRPPGNSRIAGSPTYLGKDGTYWTEIQGGELADFIERHQQERFFLYFSPLAVHSPVEDVPAKYLDRVPATVQKPRRCLAGTLIALDDAIGKCLAQLRKSGLDNNTLIFFVGDNGGQTKDGARNLPWRGGKATNWDGAVHEPYIVRWTGHLPAGKEFTGLVSTLDVYATAAVAAEAKRAANLDGVDILPFLRGQKSGDPHEALFWRWLDFPQDPLRAMRSGPWRLLMGKTE
jgi:arylsulfatase A-like enzyme